MIKINEAPKPRIKNVTPKPMYKAFLNVFMKTGKPCVYCHKLYFDSFHNVVIDGRVSKCQSITVSCPIYTRVCSLRCASDIVKEKSYLLS